MKKKREFLGMCTSVHSFIHASNRGRRGVMMADGWIEIFSSFFSSPATVVSVCITESFFLSICRKYEHYPEVIS